MRAGLRVVRSLCVGRTGELLHDLALINQQDGRHVARGVLVLLEDVEVAEGKGGLVVAPKSLLELSGIAPPSPSRREVDHKLATLGDERVEFSNGLR